MITITFSAIHSSAAEILDGEVLILKDASPALPGVYTPRLDAQNPLQTRALMQAAARGAAARLNPWYRFDFLDDSFRLSPADGLPDNIVDLTSLMLADMLIHRTLAHAYAGQNQYMYTRHRLEADETLDAIIAAHSGFSACGEEVRL